MMPRGTGILLVSLCWLGMVLPGCGSNGGETPTQALQAMIELYKARDFDTLVRTRYAEIEKAESEEQVQNLIDRFARRYRTDEALDLVITAYKAAQMTEPALSEDGSVATFNLDTGFIKLSRMPSGKWGFHL